MSRSTLETKEQIIAAMKEYSVRLGRRPSFAEFKRELHIGFPKIQKLFGSYCEALRECGLGRGAGHKLTMKELFEDWGRIVRKLGKIPAMWEYEEHSEFSRQPLQSRFRRWGMVANEMLRFAETNPVGGEWKDVVKIAQEHVGGKQGSARTFISKEAWIPLPGIWEERTQYGEPLFPLPMLAVPTSETGVLILFGALARELGFAVLRSQSEFPDCEALRRMDLKRWQLVRIEFELESRNFLDHGHDAQKCDLIICWEHNWPECPLEVLELKTVLRGRELASTF